MINFCCKVRRLIADGKLTVCNEDVAKKSTAMLCACNLGGQNRSNTSQGASAQSGDDARDNDEVRTLGCCLQGASDETEERGIKETVDATDTIGDPATDKAAHNGS